MNTEIIHSNLSEAIEELVSIENALASGSLDEGEFTVMLQHAYHHINFAWNIRNIPTSAYTSLTQEQFELWGSYPKDLDCY